MPGVGAFELGMTKLIDLDLVDVLNEAVLEKKVLTLGVCLGMQLLTKSSEERKVPGLGLIDGDAIRFRFEEDQDHLKIPHMGWNTIEILSGKALCFKDLQMRPDFILCTLIMSCVMILMMC